MPKLLIIALIACQAILVARPVCADDLTLKVDEKAPPQELAAEIRSLLRGQSVQLSKDGKTAFEFWFRSELPLSSEPPSPAKSLDSLRQPVIMGAVHVPVDARDYRGDEIFAGVYTMRFGLQPTDGNHLGTSDYSYFAVLLPAKYDLKPDAITDYKGMTKASSRDTSTGHPLILSLRPVSGEAGVTPSLQTPAPDHKSVRVRIPGKVGEVKKDAVFDIVYEGKGPH